MALSFGSPNLFLLVLGVILDIVAVAIPYWWRGGANIHAGLWQLCVPECQDIPSVTDKLSTSRGLHMFALVAGVATLIIYIVGEVSEFLNLKNRRFLCCLLSLIAGAFILIADCYMGTKGMMHPASYSISLIAAFFFTFVGGNLSSLVTISQ